MTTYLREVKRNLVVPEGYWSETGLYYSEEPDPIGRHWFMQGMSNPCRRTWLSDMQAQCFIADCVIDEIIMEEKESMG